MKKSLVAGALSLGLLISGAIVTQAGTSWQYNISVYVPSHSKTGGETKDQTKATSGAKAGLALHATQGVKLDVRTKGSDGNGTWKRDVYGGNVYELHSVTTSGNNERLEFSSDLFQGDPVQAILDWRSN
ncbi:hypothetical protein [Robertmurraya andreesenii]|uniref:DUF4430 domain-containing protein n=1 Tax=Anoxybacillus andreesenii TaxID=1325932 RepID=A0ABT9V8V7_9BACL|nr:hypothetical protein [Robertmurraya andreesenii]MDQ0157377.1 hypothetical protein [Robertmurraya andreesenii]